MGVTSLKNILYGKRGVCDIGEKRGEHGSKLYFILAMENG
jgi:hypothetical protein